MTRPKPVTVAVALLWASLALAFLRALWQLSGPAMPDMRAAGGALFFLAAAFALWAFLVTKIGRGRNWARLTFLSLFLVAGVSRGALFLAQVLSGNFLPDPVVIVGGILNAVAVVLLFLPVSSSWFRAVKVREAPSAPSDSR